MTDEETLELICPCCSSTLGIDDSGDLCVINDAREPDDSVPGLGYLRVKEASPMWKHHAYFADPASGKYGTNGRYTNVNQEPGIAGKANQDADAEVEAYIDQKIQAALDKDYAARGFRNTTIEPNNEN